LTVSSIPILNCPLCRDVTTSFDTKKALYDHVIECAKKLVGYDREKREKNYSNQLRIKHIESINSLRAFSKCINLKQQEIAALKSRQKRLYRNRFLAFGECTEYRNVKVGDTLVFHTSFGINPGSIMQIAVQREEILHVTYVGERPLKRGFTMSGLTCINDEAPKLFIVYFQEDAKVVELAHHTGIIFPIEIFKVKAMISYSCACC
jgi:hypothetical protein